MPAGGAGTVAAAPFGVGRATVAAAVEILRHGLPTGHQGVELRTRGEPVPNVRDYRQTDVGGKVVHRRLA